MPRVLFFADQTIDEPRTPGAAHPGGAELTDAAAVGACPWPVELARTEEVNPRHLREFDVHVVGNFDGRDVELTRELCRLGRHVLFEHDLRICFWRGNFPASPEYAHHYGHRCICTHRHLRGLYGRALGTIFLTHHQLDNYRRNPFFRARRPLVLGTSLMDREFFERVERLRRAPRRRDISRAVVYSTSDFKGFDPARGYCREQGREPFVIRDLKPQEVLDVLERTQRFVYLPRGREAAGRMVLEARFLGCEVVANENVSVCGESWWNLEDEQALEVVRDGPNRFWRLVERLFRDSAGERRKMRSRRLWRGVDPVVNLGLAVAQRVGVVGPLARWATKGHRRAAFRPHLVAPVTS